MIIRRFSSTFVMKPASRSFTLSLIHKALQRCSHFSQINRNIMIICKLLAWWRQWGKKSLNFILSIMRQISFNCSYLSNAGILYQIPGNLERPLEVNISFWKLFNRILNTALLFSQILQNEEILPRSVLSNVGSTLCTGILTKVCDTLLSVIYGPSNDRNEVTKYWYAINYFHF